MIRPGMRLAAGVVDGTLVDLGCLLVAVPGFCWCAGYGGHLSAILSHRTLVVAHWPMDIIAVLMKSLQWAGQLRRPPIPVLYHRRGPLTRCFALKPL